MALRMTEEEYREFMRGRALRKRGIRDGGYAAGKYTENRTAYGSKSGAKPVTGADGHLTGGEGEEKKKRRNKYGNRKVEIDGKKFDSEKEARVYLELMDRVRAGELKCVCRQVSFDLPGGIRYIADFVTIRPDMSIDGVYDVKSEATKMNRVYINKKKQMAACWGIHIIEI